MRSAPLSIMSCMTASASAVSGTFSAWSTSRSGNASSHREASLVGSLVVAEVVLRPDVDEADGVDGTRGACGLAGCLGVRRRGGFGCLGGRRVGARSFVGTARGGHHGQRDESGDHYGSGTTGGHVSSVWGGVEGGDGGLGVRGWRSGTQKTVLSDSGLSCARRRLRAARITTTTRYGAAWSRYWEMSVPRAWSWSWRAMAPLNR